jgi:hypothetical protein
MDIQLSTSVSPLLSPSLQPLPAPQLTTPPPTSMPLPPEAVYSSKEELYRAIQAWAAQHHYAFRIGRSKTINNGPRVKIVYNCDRCGQPPPTHHPQKCLQARIRQTTTRKTDCQFSVLAVQCIDIKWELRHRPGANHSIHNHPPSQSASSHPVHRKLAQAVIDQARSLHNAG